MHLKMRRTCWCSRRWCTGRPGSSSQPLERTCVAFMHRVRDNESLSLDEFLILVWTCERPMRQTRNFEASIPSSSACKDDDSAGKEGEKPSHKKTIASLWMRPPPNTHQICDNLLAHYHRYSAVRKRHFSKDILVWNLSMCDSCRTIVSFDAPQLERVGWQNTR